MTLKELAEDIGDINVDRLKSSETVWTFPSAALAVAYKAVQLLDQIQDSLYSIQCSLDVANALRVMKDRPDYLAKREIACVLTDVENSIAARWGKPNEE